jgi:hypothetical protein
MKKIKTIEKPIERFSNFSIENLNEIFGGDKASCSAGATLYCAPFKGFCLSVTIGGDIYVCTDDAKLKKSNSVLATQTMTSASSIEQFQVNYF